MHVLVVEDHRDIALWAEAVLATRGHTVTVCPRPDLTVPAGWLASVDVALVDVNIPGGPDVETTLDILAAAAPSARLLIWTAYLPDSVPAGARAKAEAVLHKPLGSDELAGAVEGDPRG